MNIARGFILVFWLLMTGWLIRFEAFPHRFARVDAGYRSLLKDGTLILDNWMRLEFQGNPVGYSHTWLDSDVKSAETAYTLRNQTQLALNLLGRDHQIMVTMSATLDPDYRLREFSSVLMADVYMTRVEGAAVAPGTFRIRMRTAHSDTTFMLNVPEDVVLYTPMSAMALAQLAPGESLRLRVLDPMTLTVADLTAEALRWETPPQSGAERKTILLKFVYNGLETLAWIDDLGRVVRQETPFGWNLVACAPEDALVSRAGVGRIFDPARVMAVPCRGCEPAERLRSARELKIRLNGPVAALAGLEGARQIVEERDDRGAVLKLLRAVAPDMPLAMGGHSENMRPFLEPSPALQSGHPDILRQAAAIVPQGVNAWEAAQLIGAWVFRNISKQTAVSLPSALDVLRERAGDCNEHTYLFVALARAAGIPARIHVGLVYADPDGPPGAFYYHAWPAVHLGAWVEMDPTLGQTLADATHISLLTGELADQMQLLGLMGRLDVEVLGAF